MTARRPAQQGEVAAVSTRTAVQNVMPRSAR